MHMQSRGHQKNLSAASPVLLDERHKTPKVAKMLAVLRDGSVITEGKRRGHALDIGCSAGFFAKALTAYFSTVSGLDIDVPALQRAAQTSGGDGLSFLAGDSQKLPFADQSLDLIVCNHVYEHVPDADTLMREIERVLRPGGSCFFGAASRLVIVEPHYYLPFLSWLPRSLADRYMQWTGRGEIYYERLRTHGGLRQLTANFKIDDYTLKIVADPDKFCARDMLPKGGSAAAVPIWLWKRLYRVLPGYVWLLRKPPNQESLRA